jgi:hypothetical protein
LPHADSLKIFSVSHGLTAEANCAGLWVDMEKPSVCEATLAALAGFPATDGKTELNFKVAITQDNSHENLQLSSFY